MRFKLLVYRGESILNRRCGPSINCHLAVYFSKVEFHIVLGCEGSLTSSNFNPLLLQYSTNGGVSWTTIMLLTATSTAQEESYHVVDVPEEGRTNHTLLRWWQPGKNGTFNYDWRLDQVKT